MEMREENKSVEIFCCYAHEDSPFLLELKKHLRHWVRQNIITLWADTDISPGTDQRGESFQHLNTAQIILLLISPDFMASDYRYGTEMKHAMERCERGEAHVIPIILRPTLWEDTPFSKLRPLPTNSVPVVDRRWHSQDEAFADIARGIQRVVQDLPTQNTDFLFRKVLLASEVLLKTRPPIIVVTGIAATGKSSLINALFGEKKLKEGLAADSSNRIISLQFQSGFLIYDTPGIGGSAEMENRTRAFLGLQQLKEDLDGTRLQPVERIPTLDAHNYDYVTDEPKQYKRHEEFEKPDLFIFVVNIKGGVKRDDIVFFREVAKIGPPVIVVVNQIDGEDPRRIQANIDFIQRKLHRQAIAVSARTGQNMQELVLAIGRSLPIECMHVIGKTFNEAYRKMVKQ